MTEWIDSKEFKRLWRALVKAGRKARPPSGLDTEHTYVKPGVKGRLQKDKAGVDYFVGSQALWVFAKREGLIQPLLSHPPPKPANLGRPPMGKQAAYEAAQKQIPAPYQATGAVDGTAAVNTEPAGGVNVTVPADTEQAGGLDITLAADTEQTRDGNETIPVDTEQDGDGNVTVAADTEHLLIIIRNITGSFFRFRRHGDCEWHHRPQAEGEETHTNACRIHAPPPRRVVGCDCYQLIQEQTSRRPFRPNSPAEHHLEKQERRYREKRRQHLCKVCSAMTPPKVKGFESRVFLPGL